VCPSLLALFTMGYKPPDLAPFSWYPPRGPYGGLLAHVLGPPPPR